MITVLAGVNGAGKSSIGGSALRSVGQTWYNPDEESRVLARSFPDASATELSAEVWNKGLEQLRLAIQNDQDFAFETTLGGKTITATLLSATAMGRDVRVWYCGLSSVELHIQRVRDRVARGGHAIPESKIRERYTSSAQNLARLVAGLRELGVYDNSAPLDASGQATGLRQLIHMAGGQISLMESDMPDWAKPIGTAVLTRTGLS